MFSEEGLSGKLGKVSGRSFQYLQVKNLISCLQRQYVVFRPFMESGKKKKSLIGVVGRREGRGESGFFFTLSSLLHALGHLLTASSPTPFPWVDTNWVQLGPVGKGNGAGESGSFRFGSPQA